MQLLREYLIGSGEGGRIEKVSAFQKFLRLFGVQKLENNKGAREVEESFVEQWKIAGNCSHPV